MDAARLTLAGEAGRRSEPAAADVTLVARFGCDNAAELHLNPRVQDRTPRFVDPGAAATAESYHHRTIETSGWEIRMIDGVPQVRPPTWIDHRRRWRPANRVLHRELERARSA